MDIPNGERIGTFEILGPLGAGGMGQVYRARDTRLGRDVAIKLLPRQVSNDAERLARFDREARVLAALNHPGIGAIYGIEESPRGLLLVLELVPGETLAERIARGPVPLDEAVQIARQIADAVAFAHANGVIHRDLKPANVKLTPEGVVKVLDFGLAKALGRDGQVASDDPTITPETTQDGAVLGTPAYMSPEQARAKEVDRRTDIWAFGCILFELLSGKRVFQRETLTDTLVAILGETPDWSQLPSTVPAEVQRILRRCLQRDRERRFHDMADVRIELEESSGIHEPLEPPRAAPRLEGWQAYELVALGTIVVAALAHVYFLYQLVPALAPMYAAFGLTLSPELRFYIGTSIVAGRYVVPGLAIAWLVLALTGRRVPRPVRGRLLIGTAAVSIVTLVASLYYIANNGIRQAVRLMLVVSSPAQVIDRDLATLHIAAGAPDRAIAVIDPKGNRWFLRPVFFSSPGRAFLLAEAYRAKGNVEEAGELYRRAQEAATAFDEVVTQQMLEQQMRWRQQFGSEITDWAIDTSVLREFPDLLRKVAQQRLDELERAAAAR